MPIYPKIFSYAHTPRMPVADAVRTSMSIPFFFSSVVKREHTLTYYLNVTTTLRIRFLTGRGMKTIIPFNGDNKPEIKRIAMRI